MKLQKFEIESDLWRKLKANIVDRIAELRLQNDNNLSEIDTAKLRGRISELKQILAMEQPEFASRISSRDSEADYANTLT